MKPWLYIFLLMLGGVLALLITPTQAEVCSRTLLRSSPPPIVQTVTNERNMVTIKMPGVWVETVRATGSMRPAIQDGSRIILIPPDLRLLTLGRIILFNNPGQTDRRVLHRIYSEGVESTIPPILLGPGPSGWTLAWDTWWYEPGVSPPDPPLEARYWLTRGDNNCLPDFWKVRYSDILGITVGIIE